MMNSNMKIVNFAIDGIGDVILLYDNGTMYKCKLMPKYREDGTGVDYCLVDPEPVGLPLGPN